MEKMPGRSLVILLTGILVLFQSALPGADSSAKKDWKQLHLSVNGSLGFFDHVDDMLRQRFHHEWGWGFQIMHELGASLNVEEYRSQYRLNFEEWSDRSDDTVNHITDHGKYKKRTLLITFGIHPFQRLKTGRFISPYIKFGYSRNRILYWRDFQQTGVDSSGQVLDEMLSGLNRNDKKYRYENGLVLCTGISLYPHSRIDVYGEMQYHYVNSSFYDGGLLFNGGIRFRIF